MNSVHPCVEPAAIVIFGASGDLTRRKLIPALHSLGCENLFPKTIHIIGVSRTPYTDDAFRERIFEGVSDYARLKPGLCELWPSFAPKIAYLSGGYDDPETYQSLSKQLHLFFARYAAPENCLFYLATPPYPLPDHH